MTDRPTEYMNNTNGKYDLMSISAFFLQMIQEISEKGSKILSKVEVF